MQNLTPSRHIILLEGRSIAQQACCVDQAVKFAELLVDDARQPVVIHRGCNRQVQHRDGGLRRAHGLDFIVHKIEFGAVAARQDHAGAGARAFDGERPAESAAGAGDQNRASTERVAVWGEVFGNHRCALG